jgi:hypothetical protein
VCPSSSLILTMDGYFHKHSWFRANQCDDNISFSCGFHWRPQTWDPVSMEFKSAPVLEFQNLMVQSAVLPPLVRRFHSWGDQARAFTAAWWSVSSKGGAVLAKVVTPHKHSLLLLPPLASVSPSLFHCNPHTSCEWLCNAVTLCWAIYGQKCEQLTF